MFFAAMLSIFFVLVAAALVWATQVQTAAVEPAAVAGIDKAPVDLAAASVAIAEGGCVACHTIPDIPGSIGQVGPNLADLGLNGAARRDGYTAEEYIRESILDPNAFIAPDCPNGPCPAGAMPLIRLDRAKVEVIVSFLSSLGLAETLPAEEGPS